MRVNLSLPKAIFIALLTVGLVPQLVYADSGCQLDQPDTIMGPSFVTNCAEFTYTINAVAGAESYVWTIPVGWSGTSTDTSITVIPDFTAGEISVIATSATCDPSPETFIQVSLSQGLESELCFVSVDTNDWNHNVVFWEWPSSGTVDSVFVHYRVTTNMFVQIGGVSRDSLSLFHDIGLGHDPNTSAHTYALTTKDTCGNESAIVEWHSTAHLFIIDSANMQWDKYAINDDSTYVDNYFVVSDSLVGGPGGEIDLAGSENSYIDALWDNTADVGYHLNITLSGGDCGVSRTNVLTPRSNKDSALVVAPTALMLPEIGKTSIYPNPSNGNFFIESGVGHIISVELIDEGGRAVHREQTQVSEKRLEVGLSVSAGIYTLRVATSEGRTAHRIVVQ